MLVVQLVRYSTTRPVELTTPAHHMPGATLPLRYSDVHDGQPSPLTGDPLALVTLCCRNQVVLYHILLNLAVCLLRCGQLQRLELLTLFNQCHLTDPRWFPIYRTPHQRFLGGPKCALAAPEYQELKINEQMQPQPDALPHATRYTLSTRLNPKTRASASARREERWKLPPHLGLPLVSPHDAASLGLGPHRWHLDARATLVHKN